MKTRKLQSFVAYLVIYKKMLISIIQSWGNLVYSYCPLKRGDQYKLYTVKLQSVKSCSHCIKAILYAWGVVRSSTKDRKELFDMTPQYKQTLNVYNAYVHYIAENV